MKKIFALALLLAIFFVTITANAAKNISALGSEVSTQKKYTLYLGTNDKDTLKQEIPIEEIKTQMHEICIKNAGGYTMMTADGYYLNDDGEMTRELSLVYIFLDTPIESIKKIMDEAIVKFNQASILLEEENIKSTFYSGKLKVKN